MTFARMLHRLLACLVSLSTVCIVPSWSQTPEWRFDYFPEPLPPWESHYLKGRKGGGLDYYAMRQDARLGSNFAYALQKGRYEVRQKRYEDACASFALAASLAPGRMPYDEWGDVLETMGNRKEAIRVYRQAVYRAGMDKEGRPRRDFRDAQGRSVFAMMQSNEGGKASWISDFQADPAVLLRYSLLLARDRQYAEAIAAYHWGWEAASRYIPVQEIKGEFELRMTPADFDPFLFEAYARTLIGRTVSTFRSLREYACPANVQIAEYERALALKPGFAPALLYLGWAYWGHYDREMKLKAKPTIARAMTSGSPAVRKSGQHLLGLIEHEKKAHYEVYGTSFP